MSYLTSCPIWLLTYLAFAWVIALKNQVIRLAGHRKFTSAQCPELKPHQEAQTLTEENFTHNLATDGASQNLLNRFCVTQCN